MLKTLRILILFAVMMTPAATRAQEQIAVRTGEHDGYSRVVLDWGSNVSYQLRRKEGSVRISFDKAGTIPTGITARAISSIDIVSTNPLVVEFKTNGQGLRRDFTTGNRVVIDLNASSPVTAAKPAPVAKNSDVPKETAASPQASKPAAPSAAAKPAPQPDQGELTKAQDDGAIPDNLKGVAERLGLEPEYPHLQTQAPPQQNAVQEPESEPEQDNPDQTNETQVSSTKPSPESKARVLKKDEDTGANKFTLSSTSTIGLAVFEYRGSLNMLTNRPDVTLRPQVTGPNADYFSPLGQVNLDEGKLFLTKTLSGAITRAQGAGLLWNIIVSPRIDERTPVMPERVNVPEGGSMRGGYMLWPMRTAAKVITMEHPTTKEELVVVTVDRSDDFAGEAMEFVDFEVLNSPVGLALRPKVDDLVVEITPQGVKVSRDGGLAISPDKNIAGVRSKQTPMAIPNNPDQGRIFNFVEWEMGGLDVLNENRNVILSGMQDMSEEAKVEGLITLAKMNLANGRGAEALGFLNYAQQKLPELVQNPEFLALRGAAKSFDWKTDWALADFNADILDPYAEIGLWKAFVLADLGDWQQAYDVLPNDDLTALRSYPPQIRNRLGVVLAEVYLRAGALKPAEDLFRLMEESPDELNTETGAALQYLKGEYNRQKGNVQETIKLWEPLTTGRDDLYRVKAGLAQSRLQVDEGKLKPAEAIDTLERLRYAWRGDELEAQINYWLGRTYFEAGEYNKGMTILRNAAAMVPNTQLAQRILSDMQSLFVDFYLDESLADKSPLDAVALYEEFTELVPPGDEGNQVISALAEHLVRTDLLGRAGNLLQHQLDHRLNGEEALRTAMRLAAIRLIDNKPEQALEAVRRANSLMQSVPASPAQTKRQQDLSLLTARALSQEKRTDQALDILESLPKDKDVNRLRADIAWQAGYWDDASFALEDVIIDENISLTRPLSDAHAMLILQQATAMNLSGDRIGLANMREKYGELMGQTNKGRLFDVITRARQNAGLADRDTLLSTVSEVDLFEDFLNSYKDVQAPGN